MFSLFNQGSLFRFFAVIFICGVTLNMFSGYVWVNPHIWLPIAVVLTVQNKKFNYVNQMTKASDTEVQYKEHSFESEKDG